MRPPMKQFTLAVAVLQAVFLALFTSLSWPYLLPKPWLWGFYGFWVISGAGVWKWVKSNPSLLTKPEGEALTVLGWANRLTLFRLLSLPALGYLLVLSRTDPAVLLPLAVWASLAFLTDFFDGYISRVRGEVSRLGQALDSGSDYILLLTLVAVFASQGLLPWWLLVAALLRLGLQAVAMIALMWKKGGLILETTLPGKAAVFLLMTDLAVRLVGYVLVNVPPVYATAQFVLDWMTATVLVLSLVDKVYYFMRTWKKLETSPASQSTE